MSGQNPFTKTQMTANKHLLDHFPKITDINDIMIAISLDKGKHSIMYECAVADYYNMILWIHVPQETIMALNAMKNNIKNTPRDMGIDCASTDLKRVLQAKYYGGGTNISKRNIDSFYTYADNLNVGCDEKIVVYPQDVKVLESALSLKKLKFEMFHEYNIAKLIKKIFDLRRPTQICASPAIVAGEKEKNIVEKEKSKVDLSKQVAIIDLTKSDDENDIDELANKFDNLSLDKNQSNNNNITDNNITDNNNNNIDNNNNIQSAGKYNEPIDEPIDDINLWETNYQKVQSFLKVNQRPPTKNENVLFMWFNEQEKAYMCNRLSDYKRSMFIELKKMIISCEELEKWKDMCKSLIQYVEIHGEITSKCSRKLYDWCKENRNLYMDNKLPKSKRNLLNGIPGWQEFCMPKHWFDDYISIAIVFDTSKKIPTVNHSKVGYLIAENIRLYKENKLTPTQITLLEEIKGWNWD